MRNLKSIPVVLFTILLSLIIIQVSCKKDDKEENTNQEPASSGEPCPGIPTVSYGGQVYNTVLIGSQCWMKESLNIGTMINGNQEQTNNSTIEKYCSDNNPANCETYGGLYQWEEIMNYITQEGTQGICPNGWHIPSDDEWKILEGTVDSQYGVGDSEWDGIQVRGFDAGNKLKSSSGWYNNGNGTDDYSFSALPGGCRYYDGSFGILGSNVYFWSSTESDNNHAWGRYLTCNYDEVDRYSYSKGYGFLVRCLKD